MGDCWKQLNDKLDRRSDRIWREDERGATAGEQEIWIKKGIVKNSFFSCVLFLFLLTSLTMQLCGLSSLVSMSSRCVTIFLSLHVCSVVLLSPFCTQSPDKILWSRIDESLYLHYGRALTASHCRSGQSWHVFAQSRPQKHMHQPEPIVSRISVFSRGSSARATPARRAGGTDGRKRWRPQCMSGCLRFPATVYSALLRRLQRTCHIRNAYGLETRRACRIVGVALTTFTMNH